MNRTNIRANRIYLSDLMEVVDHLQVCANNDVEIRMSDDRPVTGATVKNGVIYLSDDDLGEDEIEDGIDGDQLINS